MQNFNGTCLPAVGFIVLEFTTFPTVGASLSATRSALYTWQFHTTLYLVSCPIPCSASRGVQKLVARTLKPSDDVLGRLFG